MHHIAFDVYQQVAGLADGFQLVVIRATLVIVLIGIPEDEVALGQGLPPLHVGDVGVGILFCLAIRRDFSHGHLEAEFRGQAAILEYELFAFSELLTVFGNIGIGDETQGTAEPAEGVQLFL